MKNRIESAINAFCSLYKEEIEQTILTPNHPQPVTDETIYEWWLMNRDQFGCDESDTEIYEKIEKGVLTIISNATEEDLMVASHFEIWHKLAEFPCKNGGTFTETYTNCYDEETEDCDLLPDGLWWKLNSCLL